MSKMLDDCFYNQIKLLHDLSCIRWFIEKHAKKDALRADDNKCHTLLEKLEKDLKNYVIELKETISQ